MCYVTLQTQLLNIAQGAITVTVMIGSAALATKLKKTGLVMLVSIEIFFNFDTIDLNTYFSLDLDHPCNCRYRRHPRSQAHQAQRRRLPDCLLLHVIFLAQGNLIWPLAVPVLPYNVDAVRVVPIHGQEFDLSSLGGLEDLEGLEDQLRESHALVGGEVVAF